MIVTSTGNSLSIISFGISMISSYIPIKSPVPPAITPTTVLPGAKGVTSSPTAAIVPFVPKSNVLIAIVIGVESVELTQPAPIKLHLYSLI